MRQHVPLVTWSCWFFSRLSSILPRLSSLFPPPFSLFPLSPTAGPMPTTSSKWLMGCNTTLGIITTIGSEFLLFIKWYYLDLLLITIWQPWQSITANQYSDDERPRPSQYQLTNRGDEQGFETHIFLVFILIFNNSTIDHLRLDYVDVLNRGITYAYDSNGNSLRCVVSSLRYVFIYFIMYILSTNDNYR